MTTRRRPEPPRRRTHVHERRPEAGRAGQADRRRASRRASSPTTRSTTPCPGDLISSYQLDDIMLMFGAMDIEVVDSSQGAGRVPAEIEDPPDEREETARQSPATRSTSRPVPVGPHRGSGAAVPPRDGPRRPSSRGRARSRSPSGSRRARTSVTRAVIVDEPRPARSSRRCGTGSGKACMLDHGRRRTSPTRSSPRRRKRTSAARSAACWRGLGSAASGCSARCRRSSASSASTSLARAAERQKAEHRRCAKQEQRLRARSARCRCNPGVIERLSSRTQGDGRQGDTGRARDPALERRPTRAARGGVRALLRRRSTTPTTTIATSSTERPTGRASPTALSGGSAAERKVKRASSRRREARVEELKQHRPRDPPGRGEGGAGQEGDGRRPTSAWSSRSPRSTRTAASSSST